ncbi:hypothetical protein [Saccharopolyspora phatthalungensis]|uniref:UPF0716 family protein affecting phage T7 exclusion n=1 Tax=Saccharopolyspora phatthalungensis TaxID=664693 RepID=A0A840QA66_9PSEU|nr:hypothetical protein [Saccharopolyspora phatthalungensis]MBB5157674.1 UPF0716 family protein affecting phage T7 exclusion [Saccharopolyspora phatthalungensis]
MINKSRLTVLLVRTSLFFVAAVVLGFIYGWPTFAIIAAALTGGAALVQLGGVLWLRRAEQNASEFAKEPVKPDGFL